MIAWQTAAPTQSDTEGWTGQGTAWIGLHDRDGSGEATITLTKINLLTRVTLV